MSLLGELKTLQKAMCASCRQNCASSKATRSGTLSFAISKDSMRPQKRRHIISTLPRMPKINVFWRTREAPSSSSLPINTRTTSDSSSLVEISTDRRNESDQPMFFAQQDSLGGTTINVTFVHSFRHQNFVRFVCFSHDGRYLAVGTGSDNKNGSIVIYEVESHKKYCELKEYASQYGSHTRPFVRFLCFSTNGRYLVVTDDAGRVIIWDIPIKRMRSIFQWNGSLSEVLFSPDGGLAACRTDAGLVVLNTRDNSRKMVSEGSCFDFSPGGRFIATGNDGVLLILDVRTGKAVKRWNGHGHGDYLRRVKFTLDGRGLLCACNDTVEQWDVSDAVPVLIKRFNVQFYHLHQICISPGHQLLANGNEIWDVDCGKRRQWQTTTVANDDSGKRRYTIQGHRILVYFVDFSAAGTYLAMGGWDRFVSLWRCG